jgi:chloramphenicol 3-O phosphotransferase
MQLDTFIEMMPPTYSDDLFVSMVYGFHQSIGAMARAGHQIIVDHVLLLPEWVEDFASACNKASVLYVGVMCGLDELERREQGRDALRQGFARSQWPRIHAGKTYDIEVHTDCYTSEECTEQILDFYNSRHPTALASISRCNR